MSEISKRNISKLPDYTVVVDSVTREIAKSERVLSSWKTKLVKYYELYKLHQSNKHYNGLANIFVPETLRAVETVALNLYKAVTGAPPWFSYEGRDETDKPGALAMTQLVEYQMDENNFDARLMDSLRQMAITGLTVRKMLWDYQETRRKRENLRTQTELDVITGKPVEKKSKETKDQFETIRDVWTFDPVDLLTFHIADINTPYNDIQKSKWIAEQYKVDKQWIRDRVKKTWVTDMQMPILESVLSEHTGMSSNSADLVRRRSSSSGFTMSEKNENNIEIIERWGLVPAEWVHDKDEMEKLGLEKDDMVEGVIVVANRKILLKLEANPFWHGQKPYLSCPYIPNENEFAGIGVCQIGEKLQEELNDTRNQTMDNKTLILMTMWLKSRASGIKNSDLRVRPQGVIQTNDMTGLQPLRPPVLTGVGVNIEAVIKEDLRQSVGASSNLQGISQAGVNTATEAVTLNREAMGRLFATAALYGKLVLKPMLLMAEYMNYQYYDREKMIKVIGPQGVKFEKKGPDDIRGYKDIIINLAIENEDSPSVKRQQLLQLLTIMQQMLPEQIQMHWKLLDKLYKSYFPSGKLEDVYPNMVPVNEAELLTPEEEIDLILGEQPALAKKGQNHEEHIQKLEEDFAQMQYGLSQKQF